MQKYVINRFFHWNSLIFSKFSSNNPICKFVHCNGLSGLSVKTLKNHERMELSLANIVYNTEFSVEIRLEHGFAIENTYFLWK